MKKRIAFVHNAQWEMYNFRGEMIAELKNKGYDITVIVPPNERKRIPIYRGIRCKFDNSSYE